MRTSLKFGTVVAAIAIALLTQGAYAQGKGKRQQQQSTTSTEDAAKQKALDADYKRALNSVPDAPKNDDPWKTMR
jgi:hypothetical protein